MSQQAQMISDGVILTSVEQSAGPAGDAGRFIINLCSSTTPMALPQPKESELKRFTFFMSRRREDGRERFRLHMGYFTTVTEAEKWLAAVRDIYPGAWVSEAPGRLLGDKTQESQAPAASRSPLPPPPRSVVPTVHAAQSPSPHPKASIPQAVPAGPQMATGAQVRPAGSNLLASGSNVREVLAALDDADTGVAREMAALAPPRAPAAKTSSTRALSDTQVLEILEDRPATPPPPPPAPVNARSASVPLLRPDDTVTRRVLKKAVQNNAAVSFAVQLQWSIQPISIEKVPPLAIFNAYTLYAVEGSREGRRWYGLRLGFFDDAASAKQVASYVRSEFASVAVVPVSPAERTRAAEGKARPARSNDLQRQPPVERRVEAPLAQEEFKLIDDPPLAPKRLLRDEMDEVSAAPPVRQAPAKPPVTKPAPSAKRDASTGGKVRARERRPPQTLEETLEILGASALEIDQNNEHLMSEGGVRHLRIEPQKNSSFSRLLDRLTERVRKS